MLQKSDAPHDLSMNFPDFKDYSGFNFHHLKDFTMQYFYNMPLECEILKLVAAKSPMLETLRVELQEDISVEEEFKIYRECKCIPCKRASPSAVIIMGRAKPSS
ncbi:FBD domain, Leucine-rich repeat domain, L domain-like protein [Artemisia annua]|uniref:FBD domain, Leucine-rich repeat domain, L domain-like protein n=1 Tax=Artemisia annua TaxID=35608 RepID=A0A2U1QKU7_ARTAN|nr:FBD domain, Leucine-rich repeat domain, L domain-like protein [Artemisia annua]